MLRIRIEPLKTEHTELTASAKNRSLAPAKDFTTGNLFINPLRNFDFPIHTLPKKVNVVFGIEDKDFSNVKFLSNGSNAAVYTGTRENKFVAIKMLKPQIKHQEVAVQEMHIEMQVLSRVQHPNIISVYGAGEKPRKFIMLEYLGGGTLESLLRQQSRTGVRCESAGLPWESVLPIAMELASALKYLHEDFHPSAMVIHRDLKPQNIGFTADKTLKLFDFGLAVCVKKKRAADDVFEMTGNTGTLAYMAPEVALRMPYNEKVDVYSFAILLWQMLSGENPYINLTREAYMQQVVIGGERLSIVPIMARAPIGVVRLIERCWHADHTQRPDFSSIMRDLSDFNDESCNASVTSGGTAVISSKKRHSNKLSIRSMFLNSSASIAPTDDVVLSDGSDLSKVKDSAKEKSKSSKTRNSVGFRLLKW